MQQTSQLQIRISPKEKKMLSELSKKAGLNMSEYVLARLFPRQREVMIKLVKKLEFSLNPSPILAEFHDILVKMNSNEFEETFDDFSLLELSPYLQNYVAAMIEEAALQKKATPPAWLKHIQPMTNPVFGSELKSLRLYLLTNSPPTFRKRNIFIDSTLGKRI